MNIAYVNNHYQLGGAETVVRQLHAGALAAGHDSRLYVAEGKNWPRAAGLTPLYPRLLARLDLSKAHDLIKKIAPRRAWTDRSFRKLGSSKAELIHIHSYHGQYASLESFAQVAKMKPLVWTFHRFWGMTGGCDHPFGCTRYQTGCGECPQVGRFAVGPFDRTAKEWLRKKKHLSPLKINIISPSQHLAEQVKSSKLGHNWKLHVIPNGVDPSIFSGQRKHHPLFRREHQLSPDHITALFVCRDFQDPIKGFPLLEKVLAAKSWKGLQVILAGENSTWARKRLPETLNVVDLGYVRERERLAAICEASEIFLYASDGENFPCVILEAMASECCIVSAPVKGVNEQVKHNISGFISEDNTPEALTEILSKAVSISLGDRQNMGRRARHRVERDFSEARMIESHLALYDQIIAEGPDAS